MKKFLILLIAIPFLSLTTINDRDQFIGKWIDEKEKGFIEFDEEGYVMLGSLDDPYGGKDFVIKGKRVSMTYQIFEETTPIQLDIILTEFESGNQKKMLCIAQFISDNKMRLQMDVTGNRPTEFTEEKQVYFNREL